MIESVANAVQKPCEVVSSEDMLNRIHNCNKDLETLRLQKLEKGEVLTEDEERIYVLGADVIALFPSMTSIRTAKIARNEVTKSPVEFDGMNYTEMSRYKAIMEHLTSGVEMVRRLLPRRSKEGAKPSDISIRNKEINGKQANTEIEWTFPTTKPTNSEKREMRGIMCEIGVRILWENFSYRFGKKIYHQQSGGPIGARITMACSRLVMQQWGESYTSILLRSNIKLRLFGNYVDDIRQGTNLIPKGCKYVKLGDIIEFRQEWKEEDEIENLSDLQRMGNVCKEIMDTVNPDLKFTVESEEDFDNKRLQTLDFETWTNPDGSISHSFFEKSMQTPLVTMERSAMGSQQKHAILANDLIRRLSMVDKKVGMEERLDIVNKFTKKLKTSGFNQNQSMELVTSGVRGYLNKIKNREKNGEEFYRSAKSTLSKRIYKKLTAKTSWYRQKKSDEVQGSGFVGLNANGMPDEPMTKKRKRSQDEVTEARGMQHHQRTDDSVNKDNHPATSTPGQVDDGGTGSGKQASKEKERLVNKGRVEKKNKTTQIETKTVIFVPQTANSLLAKMLRQEESHLEKVTGYRVKYVEKAGQNIGSLLVRSNPWSGIDCGRRGCLLCETKAKTGKNLSQSCSKRNLTYQTWCNSCKERDEEGKTEEDKQKTSLFTYVGETAKSAHERGGEHLYDMKNLSMASHMLKHVVDKHEGEQFEQVDFRMKILKFHRSSFERQINEAVTIQAIRVTNTLLNSRSEYNRSAVPRLALKLGSRACGEEKRRDDEEDEKEKSIQDKIKKLRRKAGKRNSKGGVGNPAPKRRKTD